MEMNDYLYSFEDSDITVEFPDSLQSPCFVPPPNEDVDMCEDYYSPQAEVEEFENRNTGMLVEKDPEPWWVWTFRTVVSQLCYLQPEIMLACRNELFTSSERYAYRTAGFFIRHCLRGNTFEFFYSDSKVETPIFLYSPMGECFCLQWCDFVFDGFPPEVQQRIDTHKYSVKYEWLCGFMSNLILPQLSLFNYAVALCPQCYISKWEDIFDSLDKKRSHCRDMFYSVCSEFPFSLFAMYIASVFDDKCRKIESFRASFEKRFHDQKLLGYDKNNFNVLKLLLHIARSTVFEYAFWEWPRDGNEKAGYHARFSFTKPVVYFHRGSDGRETILFTVDYRDEKHVDLLLGDGVDKNMYPHVFSSVIFKGDYHDYKKVGLDIVDSAIFWKLK